jgi:hypothetical protein
MTLKYTHKNKSNGILRKRNTKRGTPEIKEKIIEQISNFNYLGYLISDGNNDISVELKYIIKWCN